MVKNLDYLSCSPTSERRGLLEPLSPVERELELIARHTFFDIQESKHIPVGKLRDSTFPLIIFYARKDGDSERVSVRIKTAQNRILYTGPYLPVFQAVSYAHKLETLFKKNHYGCEVTREIIEEE